jgi:hypothetical protein
MDSMDTNKYPIIEISGMRATLTPDGWTSEDEFLKEMLEIDRELFKTGDYQPMPLNAEAQAEAKRWPGATVVYLMPMEEAGPDGIVF